jgi:ribosomal protein S9
MAVAATEGSGGNGGGGNGQGGGGLGAGGAQQGDAQQQPLAYNTAAQFNQMWDNCANDVARQNLEQQALTRSQVKEVLFAAMLKYNLRLHATIGALTGQVGAAQAAAAKANVAAANAQAVAQAIRNADCFRPAVPPKYGNKKDADVNQWIPIMEFTICVPPQMRIYPSSILLSGGWFKDPVDQCVGAVTVFVSFPRLGMIRAVTEARAL